MENFPSCCCLKYCYKEFDFWVTHVSQQLLELVNLKNGHFARHPHVIPELMFIVFKVWNAGMNCLLMGVNCVMMSYINIWSKHKQKHRKIPLTSILTKQKEHNLTITKTNKGNCSVMMKKRLTTQENRIYLTHICRHHSSADSLEKNEI